MPEGYKTLYNKLNDNQRKALHEIASNRLTETKQQVEKMWNTIDFDKLLTINGNNPTSLINESKQPNMLAKVCQMLR